MELYPHQIEGVNWMLEREHASVGPKGGFLCDEMGLGKTAQLVTVIKRNKTGPTLVVVPKSCLLYTSPSPRDGLLSRMPASA